ncbi:MAG: hypothetical protein ABH827_01810 [bacterium]
MKKLIVLLALLTLMFLPKIEPRGSDAAIGVGAGLATGLIIGNVMSKDGKREAREAEEKANRAEEKATKAKAKAEKAIEKTEQMQREQDLEQKIKLEQKVEKQQEKQHEQNNKPDLNWVFIVVLSIALAACAGVIGFLLARRGN